MDGNIKSHKPKYAFPTYTPYLSYFITKNGKLTNTVYPQYKRKPLERRTILTSKLKSEKD